MGARLRAAGVRGACDARAAVAGTRTGAGDPGRGRAGRQPCDGPAAGGVGQRAECIALLRDLAPAVVVVQGTRIISPAALAAVRCPFVNTHGGVTPRYRGVHGGYWALTEGRPDLVGTTVHLVDPGIDTGTVLARTHFTPGPQDSIATYFYLHLASGLPALAEQVARLVAGGRAEPTSQMPAPPTSATSESPGATPVQGNSRLWWHPTLWGYLARRWRAGVR